MNEQNVRFRGKGPELEGMLANPERPSQAVGGVVCHPHPQYGGSMHNNVVEAVLQAMWNLGWATLRFNFRGVGSSEGEYGDGIGEAEDVVTAAEFLSSQRGVQPSGIVVAGYSFGAMAASRAAREIKNLGALLLVALPIRLGDPSSLIQIAQPVFMIAGDRDQYCPAEELKAISKNLPPRSSFEIIGGADHFFGGYEEQLADTAQRMLKTI
jgi:uncharacterized protein